MSSPVSFSPRPGTPGRGVGGEGKAGDFTLEMPCYALVLIILMFPVTTSTEAPHPRPLSPEYRGEGGKTGKCKVKPL
ncbi:MAG: hypothetical protein JWM11_5365 [Planctomycetaceae bacterium]|nr:hypothetical protein [Planctomycetaceae bacterium]